MDSSSNSSAWLSLPSAPRRKTFLVIAGGRWPGLTVTAELLRRGQRVVVFEEEWAAHLDTPLQAWAGRRGERVSIPGDVPSRGHLEVEVGDPRDVSKLRELVGESSSVVQLGARGTVELIDAIVAMNRPPPLVFVSTREVYGSMRDLPIHATRMRWLPQARGLCQHGIGVDQPLDWRAPHAGDERAADQYVLEMTRTTSLRASVLRAGCLYGATFAGVTDDPLAHMIRRARDCGELEVEGDTRAVSDWLFAADFANAVVTAALAVEPVAGRVFNIGGGPSNAVSGVELALLLERWLGPLRVASRRDPTRSRFYASDVRSFQSALPWAPKVSILHGIRLLLRAMGPISPSRVGARVAERSRVF